MSNFNLGGFNMEELLSATEKAALDEARNALSEDTYEVDCPHCGEEIEAQVGENVCPHCKNLIELSLDIDF